VVGGLSAGSSHRSLRGMIPDDHAQRAGLSGDFLLPSEIPCRHLPSAHRADRRVQPRSRSVRKSFEICVSPVLDQAGRANGNRMACGPHAESRRAIRIGQRPFAKLRI